MRRGFKTKCERVAADVRQNLEVPSHGPLRARRVAREFGAKVLAIRRIPGVAPSDLRHLLTRDAGAWSAFTIEVDEQAFALNNTAHSEPRQESDVMHEASHLILAHVPQALKTLPGFPFPLREFNEEQEEEASWLGACLQLPRDALVWAYTRGMSATEIAVHFGASADLVRYRTGVTGIKRQFSRAR